MESVVRLAAAAVAAALCAVVVKQHAREVGAVLALAAGALLLGAALGAIEEVRALADELGELIGLSPAVLAPVLKTVGIAILTRIAAELCRDAGEGGIAAAAETAGAAAAVLAALPLLRAVLSTITGLL
ncbi:SpoIIIAC/SpoIIIAD family protein [Flavonifractor sp.]|uniref:SpoIIIAC/SpoIIIAD family protein n=1 Tax=Flavonifractor sp. TaxID=2049025 RepID=UPI00174C2658|nr:SpoIIIAC/SpoIIIAD family protein [Flavonifractor sp.]